MRLGRLACFVALVLQVTVASAIAQTFVFGAQGEPVQLDPAVITDGISSRLTRQMFDGLVKYRGATTEVEPALAEKWEVSKDGKVWTFQSPQGGEVPGRQPARCRRRRLELRAPGGRPPIPSTTIS